jgi:hypothetical protein
LSHIIVAGGYNSFHILFRLPVVVGHLLVVGQDIEPVIAGGKTADYADCADDFDIFLFHNH